jgi:hypothetical protein
VASGAIPESGSLTLVRTVAHGEQIADLIAEGKVLTFKSGNEHALVKLADGTRAIVSAPGVRELSGTYRGAAVAHFFGPATGVK